MNLTVLNHFYQEYFKKKIIQYFVNNEKIYKLYFLNQKKKNKNKNKIYIILLL